MCSKYPRMPERIKTGCGDYTHTKKRKKKKKQWFLVTAGALIVNSHMVTSQMKAKISEDCKANH